MEKRKPLFAAVLFSFAILSSGFFATASEVTQRDAGLIGMWQPVNAANEGISVAFFDGGNFEIDLNGDGSGEVHGTYAVAGDKIRFIERKDSERCNGTGVYSYVISSGFLRYYPVDDNCSQRMEHNAGVWKKI